MPGTNLHPNPSFETGITGWSSTGTWNGTAALSREQAPMTPVPQGGWYAYQRRETAGDLTVFPNAYVPVTAGQRYTGSIYVNRGATGQVRLDIDFYNSSGTYISGSGLGTAVTCTIDIWTRISNINVLAPSGATQARIFIRSISHGANWLRVDGAMLEQSTTLNSYFDGDTAGYEWTGTPHNSASTVVTNTAPTANAGADQTGKGYGATVTLSGSATDAQGGTLTYAWTVQNAGTSGLTNADLNNRLTSTATFQVPATTAQTVTLRLTVTDSAGLTDTDDMTVGLLAVDLRSGAGNTAVRVQGKGAIGTRKAIGSGTTAVRVQARGAVGARTSAGSGTTAVRVRTAGGGSKRAQGAGEGRIRVRGRSVGVKRGIGTGWSAAVVAWAHGLGAKLAAGIGQGGGIRVSGWAITPPPVPQFTGRPLSEDPLPLAESRYLVQNVLTGEWLHTNLPLSEDQVTLTLSGPCAITGKITPEVADLKAPDGTPLLRSWGHVVYLEMDGEIRAAGLITEDSYDEQTQTLVCEGVSAYPGHVNFQGAYSRFDVDPIDVVEAMWAYVQSFPNGNLGVAVTRLGTAIPVRLGVDPKQEPSAPHGFLSDGSGPDPAKTRVLRSSVTAAVWNRLLALGYLGRANDNAEALYVDKAVLDKAKADVAGGKVHTAADTEIEPYSVRWWDAKDIGPLINELVKMCPADYVEQYAWNFPRTFVDQTVMFAYPRVGRRRDDLVFVQGDNIVSEPGLESDPDGWATAVIGIGAGEGSAALRETAEVVIPGRIRKTYVYRNASITDRATLARIVRDELTQRSNGGYEITSVVVRASHPNAPFGSYNVGDDIQVQVLVPHFGWVRQWGRITSMTLARGSDLVEINLKRSDSFFYGREVEST